MNCRKVEDKEQVIFVLWRLSVLDLWQKPVTSGGNTQLRLPGPENNKMGTSRRMTPSGRRVLTQALSRPGVLLPEKWGHFPSYWGHWGHHGHISATTAWGTGLLFSISRMIFRSILQLHRPKQKSASTWQQITKTKNENPVPLSCCTVVPKCRRWQSSERVSKRALEIKGKKWPSLKQSHLN